MQNVFATQRENIDRALDEARLQCLGLEANLSTTRQNLDKVTTNLEEVKTNVEGLRGSLEAVQGALGAGEEALASFSSQTVEALDELDKRLRRLEESA